MSNVQELLQARCTKVIELYMKTKQVGELYHDIINVTDELRKIAGTYGTVAWKRAHIPGFLSDESFERAFAECLQAALENRASIVDLLAEIDKQHAAFNNIPLEGRS